MTGRGWLFWGSLVVGLLVFALVFAPGLARAHGPHVSFVQPGYDCWKGTEGDVSVTHDLDRKRYLKWRCKCVNTAQTGSPHWVCWWDLVEVRRALRNIHIPEGPNWGSARLVVRVVKWQARHASGHCVTHTAMRGVISVRRL